MTLFMAFVQLDNCEVPAERRDCSGSRQNPVLRDHGLHYFRDGPPRREQTSYAIALHLWERIIASWITYIVVLLPCTLQKVRCQTGVWIAVQRYRLFESE